MIGVTPSWYGWVSIPMNAFLGLSAVLFLLTFRPKLRENRNKITLGAAFFAASMVSYSYGALSRWMLSGVRPRFRSDIDALRSLLTPGLGTIAVILFLADVLVFRIRRTGRGPRSED